MVRPLVTPIDERDRELYGRHESRYKVAKTMQPFDAPISESGRDLYGEHEYRYKVRKTMQPFDAPISEHDRNLFGEYQPRYQVKKQMQPFDAQISERERELFGEYQSRFYQPKEYQPFGTPIDEYSRELYGDYRKRWNTTKVGSQAYDISVPANGTNWVTVGPWSVGGDGDLEPTVYDISIYQVYMAYFGWAGVASWRMLIDGVKVYPFQASEVVDNDNTMYMGTLSTTVRTGQVCEIQFKSDNAADGAGVNMSIVRVFYGELRG